MADRARAGRRQVEDEMSVRRLVIATRRSRLALWQAEHVKAAARALHAGTRGRAPADEHARRRGARPRLDKVGGKGLFVKELETAMAERSRRPRGALDEGRAGRAAAGLRARRDRRARGSARRLRLATASLRSRSMPRGRGRRHFEPAARGAGARALSARSRSRCCAATSKRGSRSSTAANTTPSCSRSPAWCASGLAAAHPLAPRSVEDSLPAPGQGALGIECLAARKDVRRCSRPLADPAPRAACARSAR